MPENQIIDDHNAIHEHPQEESSTFINNQFKSESNAKDYIPKKMTEFNKYKAYKKLLGIRHMIDKEYLEKNTIETKPETGAVTFSLPCGVVYNRNLENEIARLEIEQINKKILEMYENPFQAMNKYKDEMEDYYKNYTDINAN